MVRRGVELGGDQARGVTQGDWYLDTSSAVLDFRPRRWTATDVEHTNAVNVHDVRRLGRPVAIADE